MRNIMKLEKEWNYYHFMNTVQGNFGENVFVKPSKEVFKDAIELIMEKLEINILNNEDDWSRDPQSAFKLFKNNL